VGITDYFFPDETAAYEYFRYDPDYQHIMEAMLSFNGTDNIPLTFMAGVNMGIGSSKNITVTGNYSIPVSASLITNPQSKGVRLVFGISF